PVPTTQGPATQITRPANHPTGRTTPPPEPRHRWPASGQQRAPAQPPPAPDTGWAAPPPSGTTPTTPPPHRPGTAEHRTPPRAADEGRAACGPDAAAVRRGV